MRRDLKVCPGHLAKRLGHRDSRTNMSKERDHEVTEGYQKQGAATPLGLEGWEGTPSGGGVGPACLPGRKELGLQMRSSPWPELPLKAEG